MESKRNMFLSCDIHCVLWWYCYRLLLVTLCLWEGGIVSTVHGQTDFYTFPRSVSLRDGDQFDYIVVGAGAGGATAAARLALAGQDVLLIEAGGNPNVLTKIPAAAMSLLGSRMDWQYRTVPNNRSCLSSVGQQCRFSRGKCLGGSTSINYMLYTRGNRENDFQDMSISGWTFNDLMPYFLRYEGLQDLGHLPLSSRKYHNTTGMMRTGFFEDAQNLFHSELINSYGSLHFPFNSDVNAESQIGISKAVGYVFRGERMSTARGFLAREDVKGKLKVTKNTMCTGVIISDRIAVGVTVVKRWKTLKLFARKEVILSAGTIGTPQILMLSGVGPADHLSIMGIPVKIALPVGDVMIDHVLPLILIKVDKSTMLLEELQLLTKTVTQFGDLLVSRRGALTSNGLTDVTAFVNSDCYDFKRRQLLNEGANNSDCKVPNVQFIHAYIERGLVPLAKQLIRQTTGLNDNVVEQLSEVNEHYSYIIVSPVLLEPRSQGTVRLASRDPLEPPAIFPNYLSDERDVEDMVRFINIVQDVTETPIFKKWNASLLLLKLPGCPGYEDGSVNYWRCYVRHMTFSVYHAAGTVPLGKVVDERLRVRGVRRLRVADLSVLPRLPRANTASVTIAIGERVVDFLLEDNK